VRVGVAPNDLTSIEDRDEWAGTPHHKSVPARVEKV
jgi:formate dehydrogenase